MKNWTEQGVLHQGRLLKSLIHSLWLITFCLHQSVYADTTLINRQPQHHITILYSESDTIQSEIASRIEQSLLQNSREIVLSEKSSPDNTDMDIKRPELVIAIGPDNIKVANNTFHNASKLIIASSPTEYQLAPRSGDKSTLLYMTQPFCRQIRLIKLINSEWHSFSYLRNQNNPVNDTLLEKCASRNGMTAHKVTTSRPPKLTDSINEALAHADLILALPDREIYNSKSVKNILLTSYRNRKPIFAFSRNFVNAGALAAVHSNAEQIANSASNLVQQYFENDRKFKKAINYPQTFDISINRQVFRALELPIPNTYKLKQALENNKSGNQGNPK